MLYPVIDQHARQFTSSLHDNSDDVVQARQASLRGVAVFSMSSPDESPSEGFEGLNVGDADSLEIAATWSLTPMCV
ncbi:MAG: hypothetical protein NXI22_12850 [bacterium]|nr:hypothetical protein [bacterium]